MLDVDTTTLGDFADVPTDACVNYESCGNRVPHNGQMCGDCLDEVRHNGSGTSAKE